MILLVVVVAGLLGGFWFGVLGPKRDDAKALNGKIAQAEQRLQAAQADAAQARKAKERYDADYATVARLGKAVPVNDNVPSLVYQLQAAARSARVDFRSLQLTAQGPAATATPAAATAQVAKEQNGTPSASSTSSATPAAATQATAAALPPGAVVGPAGFPTMPFSFVFTGSLFDMEHMLDDINRFISVDGDDVRVRGRLLSIDGIALQAGSRGFPQVKASISATAYLLPAGEGATAGATPQSPASTAQQAATTAGASTPPTATATGVTP
jgi:hypothetical protein